MCYKSPGVEDGKSAVRPLSPEGMATALRYQAGPDLCAAVAVGVVPTCASRKTSSRRGGTMLKTGQVLYDTSGHNPVAWSCPLFTVAL
jgi:hypothetical protein